MYDLCNNIKVIADHVKQETGNTAFIASADRAGFESVTFIASFGSIADVDATFVILVEDSDDNSTFTAVSDTFLIGVEALGLLFSSDNKSAKIGYAGNARYVRCTITPSANSGVIDGSLICIGGHPLKAPYTTQLV
jgi:hypothetical protein